MTDGRAERTVGDKGRTDGRMQGQTDECKDSRTNPRSDGRIQGQMGERKETGYVRKHRRQKGKTSKRMKHRWTDSEKERKTDGLLGRIDEKADK